MTNGSGNELQRIAMVSIHGYFDPVPKLGQTDTGGQVMYVLKLAESLGTRGVNVDIYTRWFDRSAPQVDVLPQREDVRVIRVPAGPWEFIPKERIYGVLPELARNMVAFIRENGLDYDLYHGHYVDGGIVALEVADSFCRPAFFTAHSLGAWKRDQMGGDPEEMENRFHFKHRVAEERRIFRSVRAQTVTTKVQREKLQELYDFEADNVVVIPPGVDVYRFGPGDARSEAPGGYIFCLSRIEPAKGHDLLLGSFDLVRKEVEDVELWIGGGSAKPEEGERRVLSTMRRIIDERRMIGRVRILGHVRDEDLVSLYRGAVLFALPSLFEPFGMTALEAMACGTPVVASHFGGIREVIRSGENGVLVDPNDPREFADAMIELIRDRERARRIGGRGMETVRRQFSWEAIAERHLEFYRQFMD